MTRLIVLGIDGATWKIIAPLVLRGKCDNFKNLLARGTTAVLESTIPPESPPSWTSMFTGVNPGKHGIVDFYLFEKAKFVPCFSKYQMTQSIWRILSNAGIKCIVLNNPVSYPPEEINGLMTSGLMTPPASSNWIYPPDRKEEIDIIANGYECDIPPDFSDKVAQDKPAALDILKRINGKLLRVARYAATTLDWDVLAVILTVTDRLQHFWWNDEQQISQLYCNIDRFLGELTDLTDRIHGTLLVVSDHGFGPCTKLVDLNQSLESLGLAIRTQSPLSKVFGKVRFTRHRAKGQVGYFPSWFSRLPYRVQNFVLRNVPENIDEPASIDTIRSVAFAKTTAGVFLNDQKQRDRVVQRIGSLTCRDGGETLIESILPREEALHGPFVDRAPHLFLQPRVGYCLGITHSDKGFVGTHRPEGIFIHYQSDSGTHAHNISAKVRPWDVGATIIHMMKLPVPDYFDGRPVLIQESGSAYNSG